MEHTQTEAPADPLARDELGRVAYEAALRAADGMGFLSGDPPLAWDKAGDVSRELYRQVGVAMVAYVRLVDRVQASLIARDLVDDGYPGDAVYGAGEDPEQAYVLVGDSLVAQGTGSVPEHRRDPDGDGDD